MNRDFLIVLSVIAATVLIVIATSTSFGARPLRLYDYGPPLGTGLVTLLAMLFEAKRKK